jgi:GAF domain-containing protein
MPRDCSTADEETPVSEQRTNSESRLKLKAEVEALAASDAPDEEVLDKVVRLVHDAHPLWDWSGIYLLVDGTLIVGPFVGSEEPPEHSRIEVGEGVCGTAVAEDKNQLVEDVRELDNYLACSLSTRSELVVLIRDGNRIIGQFDIDSDERGAFTEEDEALLEELAALISPRVASLGAARSG